MTVPLDQVDVDPQCLVHKCEKQGCAVDLAGGPSPFRLIDLDHPRSPATRGRCDYLFIGAAGGRTDIDLHVAALELKSTGLKPVGVSRQLAGGAKAADRVLPNARCRFVPVVAHDGAPRRQINELAKHAVRFRGKRYAIKVLKCGDRIADVLLPRR